ncbi:hypothetical protein BATDEDRAFT_26999 [Batrachochytrium dendrobatidis JAM81]|uniref:Cytochrome c oxidase assembly protein COX20, mitochondrial n=1 Tax=Batrachochytrium dendrobatidis (strain JAM81 / FGSC 10211) TaxID=684364 RepID=F4P8T9_BATDJ|nr:uncharacterized protein BATDEDRAFT_26999 [Batrachochytrium dendrobatidis JAM81]EGF78377.1 hypothetical protein BATDEDRAFT_26999 [Batrachochytrium dendrobatidis JAM81]KAJ8330745.1 hypothetical protein O5D80_001255 [Batrachochytrium dendrobatidis]KAK5664594.1 hypothetical protein QVD99_008653 [Batrachochytrium dendrobatidis]|eukprot:XP_006681113.1 hypothetical protein BATDEDRAFT_26999 [Batrachochytrium dendrobatidis JAM81]
MTNDSVSSTLSTDGVRKQPTFMDAASKITWRDFALDNAFRLPCSAQSIVTGVAAGLAIGTVRYFTARKLRTASNWGVLGFATISLCSWEFCRFQRRVVAQQMESMLIEQRQRSKVLTEKQQLENELEAQKPTPSSSWWG